MQLKSKSITNETRKRLRQSFRKKRASLSALAQQKAANSVVSVANSNALFDNCKRVALYTSYNGELNTQPLIAHLWQQGIDVYLPVLHPFCAGYLIFLHFTQSTVMKANKFGILEPVLDVNTLCPVNNLDIIFTPLVAFDAKGNRLGMGGGFYDRTLQNIHAISSEAGAYSSAKQTRVVGLAHDEQKTPLLPTQIWDVSLPMVLTPTHLYTF